MIVIRIAIITILVLWALVILITIALIAVDALRVTRRRRTVDRRCGVSRAAGDPFLHPFGEMPTVPRERLMVARDFRAWGIPDTSASGGALRRNESGGRPASLSGTAVVLTFPKRGT